MLPGPTILVVAVVFAKLSTFLAPDLYHAGPLYLLGKSFLGS